MAEIPKRLEKAVARKAPQAPNKRCKIQNQWHELDVEEPSFMISKAATPSVVWYLDDDKTPVASNVTQELAHKSKKGISFFSHAGTWQYYPVAGGSSPVEECFVTVAVDSAEGARIFALLMDIVLNDVNVSRWGDVAVSAAQDATSDVDFSRDYLGPVMNARLGARYVTGGDYSRLDADIPSTATGRAHDAVMGLWTIASLFGRDTSDNKVRAIETRTGGLSPGFTSTLHALFTKSQLHAWDLNGAWEGVSSSVASSLTGTASNVVRALLTSAIQAKEDVTNSVIRTVEVARFAQGAQVNPTALLTTGAAVLDSRGLTNKSVYASASYAGEQARLQVSVDNSTWRTVESQACASGAVAAWTALAYEFIRGFRYVRVLPVNGGTGTFTVDISAMGA